MKLLLDESVPRHIARLLPDSFEIHMVQPMGRAGCANSEFHGRAADCEFRAPRSVPANAPSCRQLSLR